jgi:UDP-N-acetylglucosamine--N-acetylmuramyl-(pentapeptide) pyrophosphoryl-undecaprenol N-acetylglucosamine transferase
VLVAGGGTGGHLFPGLAVAAAFAEAVPGTEVAFAGTTRGLEARVIPARGYRLFTLPVMGLVGKGILRRLLGLAVLPSALAAAGRVLREFRPDLVVGVGGYASAPVLFMAGLFRLPRVVLEQNAVPGVTNRIFGPHVARVFLTFDAARERFKGGHFACPGNPVRAELLDAKRDRLPGRLGPPGAPPHLLVFGGSQGARALNDAMLEAAPGLLADLPGLTITHQTGHLDLERVQAAYADLGERANAAAFIDDMGAAYAAADLVVCRAGATTVAELTALGLPSILVPYPYAAHDHQSANARLLAEAGAAVFLPQGALTGESLETLIRGLLQNRDRLATMGAAAKALGRPNAAREIVAECLRLLPTGVAVP